MNPSSRIHALLHLAIVITTSTAEVPEPQTSLIGSKTENDVIAGVVVFRHGNRAPLIQLKDDPARRFWNHGIAELTDRGRDTAFQLGQYIRLHYYGLLTNDTNETQTRSSPMSRCIDSVVLGLYGIYAPWNRSQWKQGEIWKGGPFLNTTDGHDKYTIMCKKEFKKLTSELKSMTPPAGAPWFTFRNMKLVIVYLLWKFSLGLHVKRIPDAIDAKLVQMEYVNLTEGNWALRRKDFLTELKRELYVRTADAFIENMGGEMLWQIVDFLKDVKDHHDARARKECVHPTKKFPKLLLLSYHDLNVMAIMRILNISYNITPKYSAAIFFDLIKESDGIMKVRIQYKEGGQNATLFNMTNCTNPCPLTDLTHIVQSRFSKRFTAQECGYPDRIFI